MSRHMELDRLELHRFLYLLTAWLEASRKSRELQIVSPSLAVSGLSRDTKWVLNKIIRTLPTSHHVLDAPLLSRLFYQLCVYKCPREAFQLWREQLHLWDKGKFVSHDDGAWSLVRPRLDTRCAEALLDSIVLARSMGKAVDNVGASELALDAMELILDDEVAVHKRPMRQWLGLAPRSMLWAMLPPRIARAAARRREPWALPLNIEQEPDPGNTAKIGEDLQNTLFDSVAIELASRGDLRVALTLYEVELGDDRFDRSEIRNALIKSASYNVVKLASRAQSQQELDDAAEGLEATVLLVFDKPSGQNLYPPSNSSLLSFIRAIRSLLDASTRLGSDASHHWSLSARRLTSTLLSEDPRLGQVSIPVHVALIRLHAALRDLEYTKDLWVKYRQRTSLPDSPYAPDSLPLDSKHFSWLFESVLARHNADDAVFAIRVYFDWLSTRKADGNNEDEDRFTDLWARFLQALSKQGMTHVVRRVLLDMRQQQVPLTPRLTLAILEAFRGPDLASFETNVRTLREITAAKPPETPTSLRPASKSFLPLEVFTIPLTQGASRGMPVSQWHKNVKRTLSWMFGLFVEDLGARVKSRAAKARVSQGTVRQGFNAALRTALDWPVLCIFESTAGSLAREVQVLTTSSSAWPKRAVAAAVPDGEAAEEDVADKSVAEEARVARAQDRSATVQALLSTLRNDLLVDGDGETWGLELLARLQEADDLGPAASEGDINRPLDDAMAIWEASLTAVYDYEHGTPLSRRASLPERQVGLLSSLDGKWQMDTDQLAAASSPSSPPTHAPAAQRHVEPLKPRNCSTSTSSDEPLMRPVRIRARTTGRLVVSLALARRFDDASRVYETWLTSLDREARFWEEVATRGRREASGSEEESAASGKGNGRQKKKLPQRRGRVGSVADEAERKKTTRTMDVARMVALLCEAEEGGEGGRGQRRPRRAEARSLFDVLSGRGDGGKDAADAEREWQMLSEHIAAVQRGEVSQLVVSSSGTGGRDNGGEQTATGAHDDAKQPFSRNDV